MDAATSHMGEISSSKRKQNVNKSLFDLFHDLRYDAEAKRNETCIALVQQLAEGSAKDPSGNVSKDLTYSLKRLVRGLGATQQLVQKNNFTALVSILDAFPSITSELYVDIVNKELECSKEGSKVGEGETLMGQVLAYGAAVKSDLFLRSSAEQQAHIVATLISHGKKKSYLPFASSSFILQLIKNIQESVLVDVVWPILKTEVSKPWEDQSMDSLLFMLAVNNKSQNIVKVKTVQKWLGCPLLSPQSMQHFALKLLAGNNSTFLMHPLYDEFCETLCMPSNETLLEKFWTVNVDGLLDTSSKIKEHAVLHILTIFLKKLSNKQQIDILITPRILDLIGRVFGGQRVRGCQQLYSKVCEVVSSLVNFLSSEDVSDKIRLSILHKILFGSGTIQFEKRTGTHIAPLIESKLSFKAVKKLAKQYRAVVSGISLENERVWTNNDRKFAAQQLTRLIGHQACSNDIDWKVEQLLFMFNCGVVKQDSQNNIGIELAASVKDCFFRALDQKFANLETLVDTLSKIIHHIDEILADKQKQLRMPFSDHVSTAWRKMIKVVAQLSKKSTSKETRGSTEQIFHVLFLFMGLQLFSDSNMAESALQELHSCYERVKGGKHCKKNSEEPQWVEVTIDLFLSLLSHDSHLLRTIVRTIFPYFSKHLTVSSFCQLLEVLDPSQNENPLTPAGAADIESSSSSDEDEDKDEDDAKPSKSKSYNGRVKQSKLLKNGSGSSSGGDSEDESGSEEESGDDADDDADDDDDYEDVEDDYDDEEEETVNDKFRHDIRIALGNASALTDTESVDLDELDEEESRRIDIALAQAFKTLQQAKSNKKNKAESKSLEQLTHFRTRVLDLVELYFSREPSMELCLESIAPLLSLLVFCMKDTSQKPLETRTRRVLRKLTALKKFSSVEGVDEECIATHLKALAIKGDRSATTYLGMSDLITECCTFLVRCLVYTQTHSGNNTVSDKGSVANVYKMLLSNFFSNRDTVLPIDLFRSVLHLQWNGCWCLAPLIVDQAFDINIRHFRRVQAIALLLIFFRNNHLMNSAGGEQKKCLKNIVTSIIQHTIQILNNFNSKSPQTRQESHLLTEVMNLNQQILSRSETKPADLSPLSSALVSFCAECPGVTSETKQVVLSVCRKLGCKVSSLKTMKKSKHSGNVHAKHNSNGDETSSSDNEGETNPSDVKKNEEIRSKVNGPVDVETDLKASQKMVKKQNRKAAKLKRMALMGEGLDSVTFSTVNDSVLNGIEPDDDVEMEDITGNNSPKLNGLDSNEKITGKRKSRRSLSDDPKNTKKKNKAH